MSEFQMRYSIMPELNIVVTQAKGVVAIHALLETFQRMAKDPLFDADSSFFHDFTGVDKFEGGIADHERMAKFAVTIPSKAHQNVIFLIKDGDLTMQKYLEGYGLMASESNRQYWVFPQSKTADALKKVGLTNLPDLGTG